MTLMNTNLNLVNSNNSNDFDILPRNLSQSFSNFNINTLNNDIITYNNDISFNNYEELPIQQSFIRTDSLIPLMQLPQLPQFTYTMIPLHSINSNLMLSSQDNNSSTTFLQNEVRNDLHEIDNNILYDTKPLERTVPIQLENTLQVKCSWCSKKHFPRYTKKHKLIRICDSCSEKKRFYTQNRRKDIKKSK